MSAGKGVLLVIRLLFLPLKSALALNCYFWFIRWLGRKIRSDSTFCCTVAMPNSAIRFGNLTILKFPAHCDNNTNGNFESEHVYAR